MTFYINIRAETKRNPVWHHSFWHNQFRYDSPISPLRSKSSWVYQKKKFLWCSCVGCPQNVIRTSLKGHPLVKFPGWHIKKNVEGKLTHAEVNKAIFAQELQWVELCCVIPRGDCKILPLPCNLIGSLKGQSKVSILLECEMVLNGVANEFAPYKSH